MWIASLSQVVAQTKKMEDVRVTNEPSSCVVNAHNEWDPLEEVIVGRPENAVVPPFTIEVKACTPIAYRGWFDQNTGKPFPEYVLRNAKKETDYLCHVLEQEEVIVRRPDIIDHAKVNIVVE